MGNFCKFTGGRNDAAIILQLANNNKEYYFIEFTGTGNSYIYSPQEFNKRFRFSQTSLDNLKDLKIEGINQENSKYKITEVNKEAWRGYSDFKMAASSHQGDNWQSRFRYIVDSLLLIQ